MKAFVELVTVPTRDNASSLILLHFDERRYLFGHVAEGTQRLFSENVLKIHRLSDVFLAGKTEWRNNGGLTGLLLTMGDIRLNRESEIQNRPKDLSKYVVINADGSSTNRFPPPAEPKSLTIHGGKNILNTVATTRNFVFRENSGVQFHEYDFLKGNTEHKDEFINVTPIRTFPSPIGSAEEEALREMEDMDLGSREKLEYIVQSMWNGQPGSLQVGKDDEDYVISVITRLKDDEERARYEKKTLNTLPKNAAPVEREGESPPKRQKLDSEQEKMDEDATWDDITNDTVADALKPKEPVLEFPTNRPLRRPWPATTTKSLPGTLPSVSSLSYMIGISQVRGKFRPDIAKKLGVTPGPDFRILAEGGSVTLADDTVIRGHECMDPPRPVNGVAFLDVPEEGFLESTFESIKSWKEAKRASGDNDAIAYWIWAVGPKLENNKKLLDFINTLEGKHLINSGTSPFDDLSLKGSSAQVARLNMLSSETFPLACPDYDCVSPDSMEVPADDGTIIQAQDSLILDIHPRLGVEKYKTHPKFDHRLVHSLAKTEFGNGSYWRSVQATQNQIRDEQALRNPSPSESDEVELLTLGTGSAIPSKYRNVSATVVTVPGFGNILLDCGESTFNQLLRAYGAEQRSCFLKNLKIFYISHLHADHHLGTLSVLKAWYLETTKDSETPSKLYLIAPPRFLNFLEEYTQIEDFGLRNINFIPCNALLINNQKPDEAKIPEFSKRIEEMMSDLSLERFETARAVHCRDAFTVAITFKSPAPAGFKVAYSGDTRPTSAFVEIGKNCNILLHEATFDDELKPEAIAKRHCTTSEAIQAGKDMGAQNLLLTHFSQRYPKLPNIRPGSNDDANDSKPLCDPFLEASEGQEASHLTQPSGITLREKEHGGPIVSKPVAADAMNIGFAFDMMRVKVKDFWKLEKFIPALEELFKEEVKLDDPSGEVVPENTKGKILPQPGSRKKEKKEKKNFGLNSSGKKPGNKGEMEEASRKQSAAQQ
ncbi:hypothetical protein ABW20_dc0105036 [Dactylellina cionopaga]|nr:hypothetical protein ABW20_dc0105036 [Dactylellina cionopaga]